MLLYYSALLFCAVIQSEQHVWALWLAANGHTNATKNRIQRDSSTCHGRTRITDARVAAAV